MNEFHAQMLRTIPSRVSRGDPRTVIAFIHQPMHNCKYELTNNQLIVIPC